MPVFRKPDNAPLPRWLKWMLALFVIYVVIANLRSGDDIRELAANPDSASPSPVQETVSGLKHKWRDARGLEWRDARPGSGITAHCGQRVTVHYALFSAGGKALRDTRAEGGPVSFTIGTGEAMPALEQVAAGMRVGGERSFGAPSYLGFDAPGFADEAVPPQTALTGTVELLAAAPPLPESALPIRVFDQGGGRGIGLACGQTADVAVTVYGPSGERLFPEGDTSEAELTVRPGAGAFPYWLESGLLGARIGGARTLIVPPAFRGVVLGQGGDAAKRLDFGPQGLLLVDLRVKSVHPVRIETPHPAEKEQP